MKTKSKFILMLLIPLICLNCESQEIKKINIQFVDVSIETPFQIKCENFEGFFQDEIDSISIENSERITEFSKIVKGLQLADLSKYLLPDTRIKIEVFYNNKKSYMCIDRFVISFSDELYVLSKPMIEFLERVINNKEIS